MEDLHIVNIASATIRQIVSLSTRLEEILGEKYVHLEMGNPGLPPSRVGIEAEREALARGVAGVYPNIAGIPEIKKAGSDFLKAFLDIDIPCRCIVPTVGSMQATFTLFLLMGQRLKGRDTILFLDPGFPAQHNQVKLLGLNQESIDIHDCRGEASQSFDGILSEKNRANLYSIYNLARRCGYETIEDLCENFVKNNPKLESSDLKKYVEIIKNNPEIYFF